MVISHLPNLSRIHTEITCSVAYIIVKYWSQQLPLPSIQCFFGTREGIKGIAYTFEQDSPQGLCSTLTHKFLGIRLSVHSSGLVPSVFLVSCH